MLESKGFKGFLEDLKGEKYKFLSSPQRLYEMVEETRERRGKRSYYKFFEENRYPILGISDVTEKIKTGIYNAWVFERSDQLLLIALIGPTGSGKSEIQKALNYGLERYLNTRPAYKLAFADREGVFESCPFADDPLGLLSSYRLRGELEKYLGEVFDKYSGLTRVCRVCENKLERMLNSLDEKERKSILDVLDERIRAVPLEPRYSFIEFSSPNFEEVFPRLIKNTNRGILHIEIDDKDIDELSDINYQLLLKLRDRRVRMEDGTEFKPDITVFLYGNPEAMRSILERKPLRDGVYLVSVRRNLSYSAEKRLYESKGPPFKHVSPHSLDAISKFVVATRVDSRELKEVKRLVEIYDRFENGESLTSEEVKMIKNRLFKKSDGGEATPKDGWDKGISVRESLKVFLEDFSFKSPGCLTPEFVLRFFRKKFSRKDYEQLFKPFEEEMMQNIYKDVIVSFILVDGKFGSMEDIEKEFERYYNLFKEEELTGKGYVEMPDKGRVSIAEEKERIAKKLRVKSTDELDEFIDDFLKRKEDYPRFSDVLNEKPELLDVDEAMKRYVDWKGLKEGNLTKGDEKKVKNLKERLKLFDYCDECSDSALRVFGNMLVGR